MAILSRREFGSAIAAGLPLAAAFRPLRRTESSAVVGVTTASFRDLPRVTGRDNLDDVLRGVHAVGATHIELALANVEPAPPSTVPFMGGTAAYPQRVVFTPEQVAATNASARAALRTWRIRSAIGAAGPVQAKLETAGVIAHACAVAYDDSFTDEEIEVTFRQVKALGVTTISSALTMATARRLVPFAERHGVSVAIHNQVDRNRGGAIATADLKQALALSPSFKLKLDIGNLTASNCNAVEELRSWQSRVSHVVVKDRLRNGGASQRFGEGDTPIDGVMALLAASAPRIPALVEYDYVGLFSPVEEITACLAYTRHGRG
jgi:hypothetical protein